MRPDYDRMACSAGLALVVLTFYYALTEPSVLGVIAIAIGCGLIPRQRA